MGEVVEVGKRRTHDTQNFFMRVKEALLTSKPIRRGVFIGGSERQRTQVSFKYERLPMFFHFCGVLGHDLKHCTKHFAQTKNNKEVECQYGDWLKANGGRNWTSSRKMTPNAEYQHGDTGDGHVGNTSRQEVEVEVESQAAKVTEHTNGAVNVNVSHGIEKDLGQGCSVMDETNMECRGTLTSIMRTAGMSSTLVNVFVQFEQTQGETN